MPLRMLIAGPNLTIDRTATIAELRPGEVLRCERVVVTPGGKGLNVARAARALGVPALLVGFVPGATGRAGAALIEREGIALRAVPCAGELRSTAIVIEHGGRTTVLNEPGPQVTPADWRALEDAVAAALPEHGVLVCSGSVPPGSPDDAYARLATIAVGAGRPCVVDATGATLAGALDAHPDVVCPNISEAEAVLGARGRRPAAAIGLRRPPACAGRRCAAGRPRRPGGIRHRRCGRRRAGAAETRRRSGCPRRRSRRCATPSARATCSRAHSPRRWSAASRCSTPRATVSRPPPQASSHPRRGSSTRRARPSCSPRSFRLDGGPAAALLVALVPA